MLKSFFSICVIAFLLVACEDSSSASSPEKDTSKDVELSKDSVSIKDSVEVKDSVLSIDTLETKDTVLTKDSLETKDTVAAVDLLETKDSVSSVDTLVSRDTVSTKDSLEKKDTIPQVDTLETVDTNKVVVPLCGGREYDVTKDTCYSDVIVPSHPSSIEDCADIPEYPYFDSQAQKCIAMNPDLQPCPDESDVPQDVPIEITPIDSVVPEYPAPDYTFEPVVEMAPR